MCCRTSKTRTRAANHKPQEIFLHEAFYDSIVKFFADVRTPVKVRMILWTTTMAYTGFVLTGQGLRTFNNLSITEGSLGALTGFLLSLMFTLRERRRQRPVLMAHSFAQILPNRGTFHENLNLSPNVNMPDPNSQTGSALAANNALRKRSSMTSETKDRLRAMSNTEREKRLDELNRKLGTTQRNKLIEADPEEYEEREWLKRKLGYK